MADKVEPATRMIRVHEDLADMLADLAEGSNTSVAKYVDGLFRAEIVRRFEPIRSDAEKVRKAKRAIEARLVPDLGGEG